jgi:type IV pilus assembly protein PilC
MKRSKSRRLNRRAFLAYVQNVSALLNARIAVSDAVVWATEQQADAGIRALGKSLRAGLIQGYPLSQLLRARQEVFSPMFVTLVHAGEESGLLPDMFRRMATYLEKSDRFKSKIRSALTYPLLVLGVAIVAFFFMLLVVVPNFATLYTEMEAKLPFSTVLLLNISATLRERGLFVAFAVVTAITTVFLVLKRVSIQQRVFMLSTKLPVAGRFLQTYSTATFARPLAMMLQAGIPLLTALTISANLFKNSLLKASIHRMARRLRNGATFADALHGETLFSGLLVQMVKTGEEAGALHETIALVADTLEEELERKSAQAAVMLEPFLILTIGLFIGGIVVALYLPMLDLLQIVK